MLAASAHTIVVDLTWSQAILTCIGAATLGHLSQVAFTGLLRLGRNKLREVRMETTSIPYDVLEGMRVWNDALQNSGANNPIVHFVHDQMETTINTYLLRREK